MLLNGPFSHLVRLNPATKALTWSQIGGELGKPGVDVGNVQHLAVEASGQILVTGFAASGPVLVRVDPKTRFRTLLSDQVGKHLQVGTIRLHHEQLDLVSDERA